MGTSKIAGVAAADPRAACRSFMPARMFEARGGPSAHESLSSGGLSGFKAAFGNEF